jgi:hypothetical protein
MPAGRPTKYSSARLGQVTKYLNECRKDENKFPMVEDLAFQMNVDDDTLVEWAKIHPEFSAAIKKVKAYQRSWLQRNGLTGKVNTTMSIFLLKANHGLIEVQRQEITGKDGEAVEQNMSITYMPEPLEDDYYATKRPNNTRQ